MKLSSRVCAFFVSFWLLFGCAPRSVRVSSPAVSYVPSPAMQHLLAAVNTARSKSRLCGSQAFAPAKPLRWSAALSAPALEHAKDMNRYDFFSHDGTDGSSVASRVDRTGYSWRMVGENLAYSTAGYYTPESVVADWLSSPGHCANIMQPGYSELGAVKLEGSYDFWVQVFAAPR